MKLKRKQNKSTNVLSGKDVATKIKDSIKSEVKLLKNNPCLAVIMVGDNSASAVYVRNKINACEYVGIKSVSINIEDNGDSKSIEEEILEQINILNKNSEINGILVQLPLPKGVDKDLIINSIDVNKDVDCFHPYNIGKLYSKQAAFKPCTPAGIIEILKHYNIEITGKNCVIIGRSDIVGKPMSQLMLHEDATVTICHSKTKNLEKITKKADILISAIGIPKFVKSSMISDDTVIIDVGMNRDENNKLCGDVDFDNITSRRKNISITPVPGGVGLTTVAMLMKNTINAYRIQNGLS